MEWIMLIIIQAITATNTIWEHITLETIGVITAFVAYIVGVWMYYEKKVSDAVKSNKNAIDESIRSCQEQCTMRNEMRIAEVESKVIVIEKDQKRTDEKLDILDEKVTDIRLSIKEIEMTLKLRVNGKE